MKRCLLYIIMCMLSCMSLWAQSPLDSKYLIDFDLRTQHRKYIIQFTEQADGSLVYSYIRDNQTQQGTYTISAEGRKHGDRFCYLAPGNDVHNICADNETFVILSSDALNAIKSDGKCQFNNTTLHLVDTEASSIFASPLLHLKDYDEGYDFWVLDNESLPLVVKVKNNPVEVDWNISLIK